MKPSHQAIVRNRFCADRLEVRLWVASGQIHRMAWEGEVCTVCSESAERLQDALHGCSLDTLPSLLDRHEADAATPRRSCADLPILAVRRALSPSPPIAGSAPYAAHEDAMSAAIAFRERGLDVAIATLVDVVGSSPCPLGSRLVVADNGEFWGAVSGGCVEGSVIEAAIAMLQGDRCARTLAFQIANSQAGAAALPCGGQIRVHMAPAPGIPRLRQDRARGRGLATPRMVLVGGTRVAQVLSRLAVTVGFEVHVVEPRPGFAGPGRFDVPVHTDLAEMDSLLHGNTAVVMLTHEPRIDDRGLMAALASEAFYVGALGSRKTQRARLDRLRCAGIPTEDLDRLRGPAGLAIGAVGPEEIAVSILAEVVATRRRALPSGVGCVVLAAGMSRRAGTKNKLLTLVEGVPMVRRVVKTAMAAGDPVVVVLGHEAESVQGVLDDLPVQFVTNAQFATGMASSIAVGVEAIAAHPVSAALVVLGDMPFVESETMQVLADAHTAATRHLVLVPVARERRGNPVLWPRRYFEALQGLSGDVGGRSILARAPGSVLEVEVDDPGVLRDVDGPVLEEVGEAG